MNTLKHIYFLLILSLLPFSTLFAQAKGNVGYTRQAMDNVAIQSESYGGYNASSSYGNLRYDPRSTNAYFINDTTFVIEVNSMMNVPADAYVAYLSLTQVAGSLDSAESKMNERIDRFRDNLPGNIPADDVFVDFISLVPTFEYVVEKKLFSKSATEVPTGYELIKSIHVAFEDPDELDRIMAAAIKAEIYDLVKVDYIVSDIHTVYDSLRNASADILLQKRSLYEKLGISFNAKYTLLTDDIVSTYPLEQYKSYTAYSSSALGRDKFKSVEKIKKNTAYYYDKINYNEFDLVINPVVIEPVVQFMYTLRVKYNLSE